MRLFKIVLCRERQTIIHSRLSHEKSLSCDASGAELLKMLFVNKRCFDFVSNNKDNIKNVHRDDN